MQCRIVNSLLPSKTEHKIRLVISERRRLAFPFIAVARDVLSISGTERILQSFQPFIMDVLIFPEKGAN